jgi:histone H3/H4|tara:strand:- start:160 stop:360 length:201 start_codon:yes stop_codon:yes gene_type:complete
LSELPLSAADRIIRNATGLRVGYDAAKALAEVLEKEGEAISREAGKYAKHAGRKTVKSSDIKLATE